jgi:biopolymer transport protein ExbB/TolQ
MLVDNLMKVSLLGAAWVMYLLFALSLLSIAYMIERWWFFKKHMDDADELGKVVEAIIAEEGLEGAGARIGERPTVEATVIARSIGYAASGSAALNDAVDSEMAKRRKELERGLNYLGTLGSNAPFIGLFGTVIGVIEAFYYLGDTTDDSSMDNVMGGIAEALVATGVGLMVAIPAVVAYNYFQAKVGAIESNVGAITKQLAAQLAADGGAGPGGRGGRDDDAEYETAGDSLPMASDLLAKE